MCSLPSAALGKGFAEYNWAFAECVRHSAKNLNPVVTAGDDWTDDTTEDDGGSQGVVGHPSRFSRVVRGIRRGNFIVVGELSAKQSKIPTPSFMLRK